MSIGSTVWGPYAWHMLHAWSIGDEIKEENIHWYYLFYTSFEYILPCPICAQHYKEILETELPLYEEYICRDYIQKWVYQLHNIINENLQKKVSSTDSNVYSYKKCIEENQIVRWKEIQYFLYTLYSHFDYANMSIFTFDKIGIFLKSFCVLCPEPKIQEQWKESNVLSELDEILTPLQFQKWLTSKRCLFEMEL
jgi:hypothetical protein